MSFPKIMVWLMNRKTQISAKFLDEFSRICIQASIWKRAWDYINLYGVFIDMFPIVELEFYWIIEIFWIVMFVTNFFIFQLHAWERINRLGIFKGVGTKINNSTVFWRFNDDEDKFVFWDILREVSFSSIVFQELRILKKKMIPRKIDY